MLKNDRLFGIRPQSSFYSSRIKSCFEEIDAYDKGLLMQTKPEQLVQEFYDQYKVKLPKIFEKKAEIEDIEEFITQDTDSNHISRSGIYATIAVPFAGDPEVFGWKPNNWNQEFPRGSIHGSELVFSFEWHIGKEVNGRRDFEEALKAVRACLAVVAREVDQLNAKLKNAIHARIALRKSILAKEQELLRNLNLPLRE